MTSRKLTERQLRWSQTLAQFNFNIEFRASKKAERPDALSRRSQDVPVMDDDPRFEEKEFQLLNDKWLTRRAKKDSFVDIFCLYRTIIPKGSELFEDSELQLLWDNGIEKDHKNFKQLYEALSNNKTFFPTHLQLKNSIGECKLDNRRALCFRDRLWILNWEPLQTALIQRTHDSHITGHPGRDSTFAILLRQFYWLGMSSMVRKFCRNCDVCDRAHLWISKRQGLLLPLPIPDRFHSELSIDFMTDLPAKERDPRYLMVITDRLLKSVTLETMASIKAECRCLATRIEPLIHLLQECMGYVTFRQDFYDV